MKQLFKFLFILCCFSPSLGFTTEQPTELQCLTANVFFESRGESLKGQRAIADVTINRANHPSFPSSICAVVKQPYQFSWVKGNKKQARKLLNGDTQGLKDKDLAAYQKARSIATEALSERYVPVLPPSVVSFHNTTVQPVWGKTMRLYGKIGQHYFYSFRRKV